MTCRLWNAARFGDVAIVLALSAGLSPALPGCLPDPIPVPGQQIHRGLHIENLSLAVIAGQLNARFDIRRRLPVPGKGGVFDIAVVPVDGAGGTRVVLRNVSDLPLFPHRLVPDSGFEYVVRDERDTPIADQVVRVGTVTRFSLEQGVVEEIPGVAGYDRPTGLVTWFHRPVVGKNGKIALDYHVRDDQGRERILPDDSGGVQFLGDGSLYFTAGADRTLYFLPDLAAVAEPLRAGVSRSLISGSNAVLTVPEAGKAVTVIFDLQRRSERKLPGERICCWLGFVGTEFVYAEGATKTVPARLRRFDIKSGAETVLDMPPGLADVIAAQPMPKPNNGRSLLFDSAGRVALLDPAAPAGAQLRLLDVGLFGQTYSPDGTQIVYVAVDPKDPEGEGPLMIMDTDFLTPPRVLSPVGTKLKVNYYFWLADGKTLVFWAHFGRAASDLFFADTATLQVRRVAEGIRDVSVTPHSLFGIIRTSQQDLVGDLVERNLDTGAETIIARSVDSFAGAQLDGDAGTRLVYTVRNRAPTDMDGLWSTVLPP